MKVESKMQVELESVILVVSLLICLIVSLLKTQPLIKQSVLIGLTVLCSGLVSDILIKSLNIKNSILKVGVAVIMVAAAFVISSVIVK